MAKPDTIYVCQSCGALSPKWAGKCDACGAWNTLEAEAARVAPGALKAPTSGARSKSRLEFVDLSAIAEAPPRFSTGIGEFDRVCGGGLVPASAVLIEAALSFLGVGVPAQVPSWGNMMAEGRNYVAVAFHIILFPGLLLAATVLAINLLGDGLRDALDPRLARQL